MVLIVKQGIFEFEDSQENLKNPDFTPGTFIGECKVIMDQLKGEIVSDEKITHLTTLVCRGKKTGEVMWIMKKDIQNFLRNNPGLRLIFEE